MQNLQMPVLARLTIGGSDYRVDRIPDVVIGQSYVVLSRSDRDFRDGNILAGPAVLEVFKCPRTAS